MLLYIYCIDYYCLYFNSSLLLEVFKMSKNMNCYQVCNECEHKIITLKKYSIQEKCKFKTNNYIYKNGSPIKCTKFKLKNNNKVKAI